MLDYLLKGFKPYIFVVSHFFPNILCLSRYAARLTFTALNCHVTITYLQIDNVASVKVSQLNPTPTYCLVAKSLLVVRIYTFIVRIYTC